MAQYEVKGYKIGGWDVSNNATSLRQAIRYASNQRSELPAESGSKVRVYKNGVCVKAWTGTTDGKWTPVVP